MRLSNDELNEIKKKFGVNQLWSFSKFDSYRTSKYEWMLKYIKHLPENNEKQSAYASLGGAVHDVLEGLYEGTINYEDMLDQFEDIWMTNIDIAQLVFDRNDSTKNDNIKNKYYKDLVHFFKNYKMLPYKMQNEQFVTIKITDDIVMQGYIDAVYKNEDDVFTVVDYKTSTQYSGKAIEEHAAQLVLYSEALRQLGVPKDKIRCCWNFLKYVNIDCEQMNGKIKTRTIERYEIGEKLQSSVKAWLKKLGYEDKMTEYLDALAQSNDIECLPEDVQAKYAINDCYVYVDDIWNFYEKLKEEIIETIAEINEKTEEYQCLMEIGDVESAEKLFWDDEESLKAQSYYFNNLCGYSIPTIKPYKLYLDKTTAEKNGDLLGGAKKSVEEDFAEDDLSWLNSL
jgi:RecB family exonuclease